MNNKQTSEQTAKSVTNGNRQSYSILVADDDQRMAALLIRILRDLGHKIAGIARNGKEAVEFAERVAPELAILDINMPVMDGIEAARQIVASRNLPVIFSTGDTEDPTLHRIQDIHAGAYLVKPFSPAQLKAAVHLAMSQHKRSAPLTVIGK